MNVASACQPNQTPQIPLSLLNKGEAFEKPSILSKVKEDEDFNHRNTLSISRIKI